MPTQGSEQEFSVFQQGSLNPQGSMPDAQVQGGELVQLSGFTQSVLVSAGAQYLQRAPWIITAQGAVIFQGSVDTLDVTAAPYFHMSDTAAGAGAGGTRLFVELGAADDDISAALRIVTTGAQVTEIYSSGTSIPGSGMRISSVRWDATTLYASVDGVESAGNPAVANQVLPPNNFLMAYHPAGGNRGLTYSGMQWAAFSSAIIATELHGLTLLEAYRSEPTLISLPHPEAGVLVGTEIGTPYWRDALAPVANRGGTGVDHSIPNDMPVVGLPGSGRLNGLNQCTVTDYAQGPLQTPGTTVITMAAHITTAADITTTQGVVIRDGVVDNLGIALFFTGGNLNIAVYKPGAGFYGPAVVIGAIPATTEIWLFGVYDLAGDTLTAYIYDAAGTQLATGTNTHVDYSLGTVNRPNFYGRTVGGNPLLGTLHELLTYEDVALTVPEIVAISDGSDLTADGKLSRQYVGLASGVEDAADPTTLWYAGGAGAFVLAAYANRY